jgi:hypothetical protein
MIFYLIEKFYIYKFKFEIIFELQSTRPQVNPAPSQPGLKIGQPGPKIGQSGPTVFLFGQCGPKIGQCGPKIGHSGPKICIFQ